MNVFKISGTVLKKEKQKGEDRTLRLVLAVPLNMKIYSEGTFKPTYDYLSFSLYGLNQDQSSNLRKGNYVEIIGYIIGNCDKDGNNKKELTILPKTITKGVIK